ncbi:hypothetical protein BGZ70_009622 [Mortierella alpina]|uniref:Kelch repeat protein n=1 Tax=Mortierella alpina TaxID=64518 RepID=A0A9P6J446_MORAP|nr:hypothetical protein BGZ70_009622 [Mortierella alpina]
MAYVAGGTENGGAARHMAEYDLEKDTVNLLDIPEGVMLDRKYYAGTYLKTRGSIVYFGGQSDNDAPSASPGVWTEFVPGNRTWNTLNFTNVAPSHRILSCIAASEDGSKVVVFSGLQDQRAIGRDIWILDVARMTWTQGPLHPQGICMNACTIVNNTFISWGGYNRIGTGTANGSAILYDIAASRYITNYEPPIITQEAN